MSYLVLANSRDDKFGCGKSSGKREMALMIQHGRLTMAYLIGDTAALKDGKVALYFYIFIYFIYIHIYINIYRYIL